MGRHWKQLVRMLGTAILGYVVISFLILGIWHRDRHEITEVWSNHGVVFDPHDVPAAVSARQWATSAESHDERPPETLALDNMTQGSVIGGKDSIRSAQGMLGGSRDSAAQLGPKKANATHVVTVTPPNSPTSWLGKKLNRAFNGRMLSAPKYCVDVMTGLPATMEPSSAPSHETASDHRMFGGKNNTHSKAKTPAQRQDVIVYLGYNSEGRAPTSTDSHHATANHTALLIRSLSLLYTNFNNQFHKDVVIFHTGDFSLHEQDVIRAGRSEIRFEEVKWTLPEFLSESELSSWAIPGFSIGYRHMIRWYSVQIYTRLNAMGYDWFLRLDDDSMLLSPIRYDIFEWMAERHLVYGYRLDFVDNGPHTQGLAEMIRAYLVNFKREPCFLYEYCSPASMHGLHSSPVGDNDGWSGRGFYSNFMITNLAFWLRPEVQSYLQWLDRSGGFYTNWWGDLGVQSAAVQIFVPKYRVHRFRDFTYQHTTMSSDQTQCVVGGAQSGTHDPHGVAKIRSLAHQLGGVKVTMSEKPWVAMTTKSGMEKGQEKRKGHGRDVNALGSTSGKSRSSTIASMFCSPKTFTASL